MTAMLFVTPRRYGQAMRSWDPWAELRGRTHIELGWADLPEGVRGAWVPRPGGADVLLDVRLGRRDRAATLAHELVHDERGIAYGAKAPAALVAKEERIVDRIVADRLVPPDELARFVARRSTVGPVTAADVADEFDVAEHVAARALGMLKDRLRPAG